MQSGRVEHIDGGLLVQPEEPQEGQIPPGEVPGKGTTRTELPQGDRQPNRGRFDVGRRGDTIHLMHLVIPGGQARSVVGPRCPQQLEPGAPASIVDLLGIVRTDGVARRRNVAHREHLIPPEGPPQRHPQAARMNRIVDAWLKESEPPGFLNSVAALTCETVRLDEPIHLLPRHRVRLESIDLNRLHPGDDVQGRHGRIQRENVDVWAASDLRRVDEKEELASYVVRVVEDERVDLYETLLAGAPAQTELSTRHVARLLSPDTPEIQRTCLPRHKEAEVSGRNALGQKARPGKSEGDVPQLHRLQHRVLATLIENAEVVGGRKFARLVEIDIECDTIADRSRRPNGKLNVGAEPWQQTRFAGKLHLSVARSIPGPITSQFSLTDDLKIQVVESPRQRSPHRCTAGGGPRGSGGLEKDRPPQCHPTPNQHRPSCYHPPSKVRPGRIRDDRGSVQIDRHEEGNRLEAYLTDRISPLPCTARKRRKERGEFERGRLKTRRVREGR